MTYRKLLPVAAAALLTLGAAAGVARAESGHAEAGDTAAMAASKVTLVQAITLAEHSVSGTAIDAGLDSEHGKPAIAVAVAASDGVHTVLVDMATGKLAATQPGGEHHDGDDDND
jgi:uncharacterized membrane protein YkoI